MDIEKTSAGYLLRHRGMTHTLERHRHVLESYQCMALDKLQGEIESLRADLKLTQAQRDAGNREIERLRDLLACRGAEGRSHQCRACFHSYTPAEGESEDCPRCGSAGRG